MCVEDEVITEQSLSQWLGGGLTGDKALRLTGPTDRLAFLGLFFPLPCERQLCNWGKWSLDARGADTGRR